jgi:transcriptional regulator with XRE-family HTH domain
MGPDDEEAGSGIDGRRLRQLRFERGLSLKELAAKASVSASLVSQLERGVTSPSISSLKRLATALDVSIFELLDEGDGRHTVVRAGRRRTITLRHGEIVYELLSPTTEMKLEVWMGNLSGARHDDESESEPSVHMSEEFILVMDGTMDIEVAGRPYRLRAGDSIQYDGNQPHTIRNAGDSDLRFLSALTPPTL